MSACSQNWTASGRIVFYYVIERGGGEVNEAEESQLVFPSSFVVVTWQRKHLVHLGQPVAA